MIFSSLLKPKWQHRNPEIRQLEVENLDDPSILHQIARNDVVVSVRQTAIRKITELDILNEISQQDIDNSVQELAKQRLKQLICCRQKTGCPTLENRLNWIKQANDAEILTYVAENAPEVDLRLIVIDKINREGLLGDIAVKDTSSEVRLAAVAKLTQKSTLERVVKAARNRDKKVSKIAKEKLDAVIEKLERPAKILAESKAICTKLESLEQRLKSEKYQQSFQNIDGSNPLKTEQNEFQRLQERWQVIADDAEPEFKNNFDNLQTAITAILDNHQHTLIALQKREKARVPLRTAKQELCDKAETLLIELKKHQSGKDTTAFEQRFDALKQQWIKDEPLDIEVEEKNWQERFTRLSQSIQKRHQKLHEYHKTTIQLENVCKQGDRLTNNNVIKTEQVKNLQYKWSKISQSEDSLLDFSEPNQRFSNLVEILQAKLQKQKKQCNEKTFQLEKLLAELEVAVDAGELKTALPIEKQARQLSNDISNLSTSKLLEKRLRECSSKIGKLRSWQNWSGEQGRENLCQQVEELSTKDIGPAELIRLANKAQEEWKQLGSSGYSPELWKRFDKACQTVYQLYREQLCLEMEQLCENSLEPEATANLVRKAQTTWKQLGPQGNSQELWERFNKICQTVYEPCKTYFDEKANERQQNLVKRQKLCEQSEKFINTTNWEASNWKEVRRFCHNIENDWRAIGVTNRKDKKIVQSRFTTSIDIIKSNLQVEQQRNCSERLLLLYKVENIANSITEFMTQNDDKEVTNLIKEKIDVSINEVKKLQEQWKSYIAVPGSNRIEHEFWEVFRGACDVIFNHRKQQQELTKKQRQSHLETRITLCEQVETLVNYDEENIISIPQQLKKLQEEWKLIREEYQSRTDIPKNAKDAIEDRFNKACRKSLAHHQNYLALERYKQLDLLKQKVNFCVELEQNPTEHHEKLDIIQNSWNGLAKLNDTELEFKVEQRFQTVFNIIKDGGNLDIEDNLEIKEILCIRMEILAGIESPLEANGARLAYQVGRLSAVMNGKTIEETISDPKFEAEEIEWDWYSSGAVPSDKTQMLEQRFHRATTAFYAKITC